MAILVVLIVASAWVSDDAYISFRVVDNFLSGRGLTWNPGERVQAFTHPLWLFALILVTAVVKSVFVAAIVLGVSLSVLGAFALLRMAQRRGELSLAIVAMALLASRAVFDFSTSGLENPLTAIVLIGLAARLLEPKSKTGLFAGLSIALLYLTRPDAPVLVLPLVLWHFVASRERGVFLRQFLAGVSPLVLWELFSLWYYGALVPNTAFAKLGAGLGAGELAWSGLRYLYDSFSHDPVTLTTVAVGASLAFWKGTVLHRAAAVGLLLHLGYIVVAGGDFMSGRFLTGTFVWALVLLATGTSPLRLRLPGLVIAVAACASIVIRINAVAAPVILPTSGIADERAAYSYATGIWVIASNGGVLEHPLASSGRELAQHGAQVIVGCYVGMLGFFAGPEVHIVDVMALTEPFLARLPGRDNPRVGHFERALPPGYFESLVAGQPQLNSSQLNELWRDVRHVASGDLTDPSRIGAIFRLLQYRAGKDVPGYDRNRLVMPGLDVVYPTDSAFSCLRIPYGGPSTFATGLRIPRFR
ncbi:hypothetical protein [Niveibacterium umoris]|uniref:hypothetical protein n=1 Tax=Niveibacterium umoris TaxID=1193620 RepID=UPI00161B7FA1|nr:hypothetical protein [Niveibacterium umoris]